MLRVNTNSEYSRRVFLGALATSAAGLLATPRAIAQTKSGETYETEAKGIRILPGAWRRLFLLLASQLSFQIVKLIGLLRQLTVGRDASTVL